MQQQQNGKGVSDLCAWIQRASSTEHQKERRGAVPPSYLLSRGAATALPANRWSSRHIIPCTQQQPATRTRQPGDPSTGAPALLEGTPLPSLLLGPHPHRHRRRCFHHCRRRLVCAAHRRRRHHAADASATWQSEAGPRPPHATPQIRVGGGAGKRESAADVVVSLGRQQAKQNNGGQRASADRRYDIHKNTQATVQHEMGRKQEWGNGDEVRNGGDDAAANPFACVALSTRFLFIPKNG